MSAAHALAHAANQLVGVPFRLHGREPLTGLDCIGLVAVALVMTGRDLPTLPNYAMRNINYRRFLSLLPQVGLTPKLTGPRPGDVVLLRPSPAQFHLAIIGRAGASIHAHAGLGRVVESPAPLSWPVEARWHLTEN